MQTRVRNKNCLPHLGTEGELLKPLCAEVKKCVGWEWHRGLNVYKRLNCSHTLASVRRCAYFRPFEGLIPSDALDMSLASTYDHARDFFPDKPDVVLQAETMDLDTWRRLRNTRDVKVRKDAISIAVAASLKQTGSESASESYTRYNENHPVHIGGVKERRHPSDVKLMNTSHHSPQTNAGFSRQDRDGNTFVY